MHANTNAVIMRDGTEYTLGELCILIGNNEARKAATKMQSYRVCQLHVDYS